MYKLCLALSFVVVHCLGNVFGAEAWPQVKYDAHRSGNVAERRIAPPLGLVSAAPLTDAIFTSPAVVDGRVYVVDGSGVAFCLDAASLKVIWQTPTDGGALNVNNVSSPAVVEGFVHFGTMAGNYYVLKASDGSVARKIETGDPIFSAPAIAEDGKSVYFATLGSRVYCLTPDGKTKWTWDFVREVLKFDGDRWNGEAWARHLKRRVTWREQFCCSRDVAFVGKTLVIPAGGSVVWLEDAGDRPVLRARHAPNESPSTLGLSLDAKGTVYRQWYRRDNTGSIETLRLADGKVVPGVVRGTETSYQGNESMSFSSVSVRGDVYRCRPEEGFGLCRHRTVDGKPLIESLGAFPSIAPPILTRDKAIVCGLDGGLYVVPLAKSSDAGDSNNKPFVFQTPFRRPITAPAAVCDGRIFFGGEDGYLYVLGPDGKADPPRDPLPLTKIRSPLSGKFADAKYDWFTNFGNLANTNRALEQDLKPPLKLRWIRRLEGTIKHMSVCGGGRIYTHTAEGQIYAVEQETGRLLWRVYYPGVHVSYTAPIYHNGKLLVPQAGFDASRVRCLDAATGKLLWEAPFAGSPSWNRQLPPIIHEGLVIYPFSTGKYTGRDWLFEHQNTFGFPAGHKPVVKAWDLETGRERWSLDFSEHASGGDDAGLCLMDGKLYYSCYFGRKDPPGVTAAIEPATGKVLWKTTKYAVHGGCTISAKDGRLYLGGYNAPDGKTNRIWCLDARDGALVWQSDPINWAIHVVTIADDFVFTHSQYQHGTLLDLAGGKKICELTKGYNCTRFTMSGRYLLGANMDIYDTSQDNKLIATGPAVDVLLCVGAHVSNGRILFTANGGGLQLSMSYGEEAIGFKPPWAQ